MLNRLLITLTIVIGLTFIVAQIHPTHAQSRRLSSGYLEMIKQMILAKAPTFPTRTPSITPTPTLYIAPIASPTATPTLNPSGTNTPTPMQSPTPTPTKLPTVQSPTPTKAVTATPTQTPTIDVTTFIMGEINKYRASQGLGSVAISTETCNFAATRAVEISTSFNHDGFQNRINNKTLPYTSWTKVTENIAMTSNYKDVVTMWINSPGHAANMRADTPLVCVKQHGNYFAYEGMKL